MNAQDLAGIRYVLLNKYGFKVVTHPTIMLVSEIISDPGNNAGKYQRKLTKEHGFSRASIFRNYKKLREYDVIDEHGFPQFTNLDMRPKVKGERLSVPLVGFVRERILSEDMFVWVHIAAWIAEQPNCIEMCHQVKDSFVDMAELIPMLKEMQNGLALCAIMAGDITNWIDMKGETHLNEDALSILKRAGIEP